MIRNLRVVGTILVLTTLGLWLADAASWIPSSTDEHWWRFTLKWGTLALAGALLLHLLRPVGEQIRQARCTVCGNPTQRGHLYCLDHLQEAVNATRDEERNRSARRKTVA